MSYVLAFAPWIVYSVVPSSQWRWGALAALAVCAATLVAMIARRRPASAMMIEIGSAAFFVATVALAFADPHTALHPYMPAAASLWLALISWFSLAIRHPFTLGIARLSTPREVWHQPMFRRTNVIITLFWALAFTIGGAALVVCAVAGTGTAVKVAVQLASFVVPIVFTTRYVAVVQARVATLRAAAGSPPGR